MNINDDIKKRIQAQLDGKGIYISHSLDIKVVERFFKKLFGIKDKDKTEEQDNGKHKTNI